MRAAEQAAVREGVALAALMEYAGTAAARAAAQLQPQGPVLVLCGPGANGGDGFVAARVLKAAGRDVQICLATDRTALRAEAAVMADVLDAPIDPLSAARFDQAALIIDALFGTGLSRPLAGALADATMAANDARRRGAKTLAVDIPSGVDPTTGAADPAAIIADRTIAFAARKPGHLLFPGRLYCGETLLADIGVPSSALVAGRPMTFENAPGLWGSVFPRPAADGHKYARGAAAVISGPWISGGAARLAARGALRAGAGLVTIFADRAAAQIHAAHVSAVMVREVDTAAGVAAALGDPRLKAVACGPGCGVDQRTRDIAIAILKSAASAVLDAVALTVFEPAPEALFGLLRSRDVLTPHAGEFERLVPGLRAAHPDRINAARAAARRAGATIVLKGPDTIISAPDGRAAVNANAPADLATAGSGDVLAGFITGLAAQGCPGFEAAAAGVWLHGAVAQAAGPGLIAEDLPEQLPLIYRALLGSPEPSDGNARD